MKQCQRCGRKNQNSATFCQGCGWALPILEIQPRLAASTRIAIVIIILLLGVIGYLLTSRTENNHVAAPQQPRPRITSRSAVLAVTPTLTDQVAVQKKSTVKTASVKMKAPKKTPAQKNPVPPNRPKPMNVSVSEMVLIPAGKFTMGSPDGVGLPGEHPQHQVYLDAFYIDKNPVTFDQYDTFCEKTGSRKPDDEGWGRGNRPVIGISWDEATAYASWSGKRLPTEAEYEKAARGGTDTRYFFGDDPILLGDYAWYGANAEGKTHPIGQKSPNPFGLYGMMGNVSEWCSDWYGNNYYAVSPAKNPRGPDHGTERVLRGGSWWDNANFMASAKRSSTSPEHVYTTNGFRCAKTP